MPPDTGLQQTAHPFSAEEARRIDAWWRAANYLSVGQIYLLDNPLLKEPLELKHIKPRLLGHWGTTPGLNFIYVHLNRAIKARDLDMICVTGPGHGGPGIVANTWLEGTYSEIYPHVPQNARGMQRLFKQFSVPGGTPSHAAPETPGSIHEGGELGYALSHAYGAVFDNPNLIAACVVGDGEAETGPMATSWHSNKFLEPGDRRGGAADPASERLQVCGRRSEPRRAYRRGHHRDGAISTGRAARERSTPELPRIRPGRDRVQSPVACVRGNGSRLGCRDIAVRRPPVAGRSRYGDSVRTYLSGLARRLSADRPAWSL
jgi:XFP N-terminal domain